jgi:hypothetical protein
MKRFSIVLLFVIASCGYEGGYRYECQIPENWENEECNPPNCIASGECTKDLLGFDPTETTITITQDTGDSNG